jgi:diguanylate cyclase (GGDEF)-like protein
MTQALESLLAGIDQGIQDHLEWNQRLMRCALLRESPGGEVLLPDADRRCRLGMWLLREQDQLAAFDGDLIAQISAVHRTMHDAVRSMCGRVLEGAAAAPDDLHRYEHSQTTMVSLLGHLRGRVTSATARIDPLTGLPLRHTLARDFAARREDTRRFGAVLHVAMVDIDRFKTINDTFGHLVGDAALRHLATVLRAALRTGDGIYRFGGEEFVVLLPSTAVDGGERAARRMLEAVRAAPLCADSHVVTLTVTIGLTLVGDQDSLDEAIERADQALLDGKKSGRDRIVVAGR